MIHRIIRGMPPAILALILVGCGPRPQTQNPPPPQVPSEPSFKSTSKVDRMASEAKSQDDVMVGPLISKGEKTDQLSTYNIPERVHERLKDQIPTFTRPSKAFKIQNPHLKISAKNSTMTFTGTLRVQGRPDEAIELSCRFDRSQPWTCGDMYPSDGQVKKERRLQATVNCLDSDRCDWVGLQIYVLIDGKVESQLFQTQNFSIRQADSGDASEFQEESEAAPVAPQKPSAKLQGRLPRQPSQPSPPPLELPKGVESYESELDVAAPALSDEELDKLLDDPNAAIEIEPPVWTPTPNVSDFSIPGIESLDVSKGQSLRAQAHGSHTTGYLRSAAKLPATGSGFMARQPMDHAFGTDLMMQSLKSAAAEVAKNHPRAAPIVIASISKSTGGTLLNRSGRAHRSHKNGLDVDVVFPAKKNVRDMWNACSASTGSCANGAGVSRDFDEARFWQFAKALTCSSNQLVRVMFLDKQIKRHMCDYVRRLGEKIEDPSSCAHRTLKAMKHSPGHHNHVHIRLRCPGNRECQERTFDLGRGTGC